MNPRKTRVTCFLLRALGKSLVVARGAVFISLLLLTLDGCGGSSIPLSFEGLCGLSLEQFTAMDETVFTQWVREEYGITPSWLGGDFSNGRNIDFYEWKTEEVWRSAWFADGQLVRLSAEKLGGGPTFSEVIAGLGVPAGVYRSVARVEDTGYEVILEYPQLGFAVGESGHRPGYVTNLTLSKAMRVNTVYCYVPDSMANVFRDVYLIPAENVPLFLEYLLPWPGFGADVPLPP